MTKDKYKKYTIASNLKINTNEDELSINNFKELQKLDIPVTLNCDVFNEDNTIPAEYIIGSAKLDRVENNQIVTEIELSTDVAGISEEPVFNMRGYLDNKGKLNVMSFDLQI